jgi:glutaredoxin-like protein NrdH
VKEFLSRAGRPFTVRDVDEDLSAYQELVSRGFRTVPVTIIGGTAIKGFDEAALTRALEDASTP